MSNVQTDELCCYFIKISTHFEFDACNMLLKGRDSGRKRLGKLRNIQKTHVGNMRREGFHHLQYIVSSKYSENLEGFVRATACKHKIIWICKVSCSFNYQMNVVGLKAQQLPQKCSEVEYKYVKVVLKYSTWGDYLSAVMESSYSRHCFFSEFWQEDLQFDISYYRSSVSLLVGPWRREEQQLRWWIHQWKH